MSKQANSTPANAAPATEETTRFIAWHVKQVEGGRENGYWTRIGAAFPHKDGKGFTVLLDLLPPDGKVILREYEAKDPE